MSSNRDNINLKLPTPDLGLSPGYFGRLVRVMEQFMYAITSIREWVVSTLTIQDPANSGYNLQVGVVYVDDQGFLKLSILNVAALSGVSSSISSGTVTVTTS
jgi:hypothetical protein